MKRAAGGVLTGVGLIVLALCSSQCKQDDGGGPQSERRFVGAESCRECHSEQAQDWVGSHHDLAMQVADESTVLGDFGDVTSTHFGLSSQFFRRDGAYFVRTDGPDGEPTEYPIAYTFGVDPLQQYLIEFPDGRIQVLSVCWDTRSAEEGGQRWFHLYPNERIDHTDPLHWTGNYQNWNFMCAECHSTGLDKGYDAVTDRYATTWSEIDVSCEACHGPASQHVEWARGGRRGRDRGLAVRLKDTDGGEWVIDKRLGSAARSVPRKSQAELETCARCHSRRSVIAPEYVHGRPLLDSHLPALLEEPLYFADGQIRDEVYVYGSFLQSKMHAKGVTCSDCHDPHTLEVKYGGGNQLCNQCHLPEKFDTPAHHFHQPDSAGARCVECHMPERTYMVVDPRRDHSLRIPDPDLSVLLGTPNACNACHTDQDALWAAAAVAEWYGSERALGPHWGALFAAARAGLPGLDAALAGLIANTEVPAIVRATAVSLLRGRPDRSALPALAGALSDADPMVRSAAVDVLDSARDEARLPLGGIVLDDPVRAVRIGAGRVLASVPAQNLGADQKQAFERALAEYVAAQNVNADRAEAHVNLAGLYVDRGEPEHAEAALKRAIAQEPFFVGAYVNLADLYRSLERDDEGEAVLRKALEHAPDDAGVHHSLGLVLVRLGRVPEALLALQRAADLAPGNPRYAYVYAVALYEQEPARAIGVLEETHARHPGEHDVLQALVLYLEKDAAIEKAIIYARKLLALNPEDRGAQGLLERLLNR